MKKLRELHVYVYEFTDGSVAVNIEKAGDVIKTFYIEPGDVGEVHYVIRNERPAKRSRLQMDATTEDVIK